MRSPSSSATTVNKRSATTILGAIGLIFLIYLTFRPSSSAINPQSSTLSSTPIANHAVAPEILQGDAIAPKLENATAKAELGRAAWKLFHTMMAKFPDKPSQEEQTALASYIHLFARLYPCGECAQHFQQILKKYPPQISTRSNAAAWACHVHNEVNKSLEKELFDCSNIGDFYDCGCADDDEKGKKKKKDEKRKVGKSSGKIDLVIEENGPTRGG